MTMLAKYNSKINSPDIWLTPLVLVISLTLANMNLEIIEEASVNWLIHWFHLAGTYIVGLFRNVLTTRSCCIETGEIPMHQQKVLAFSQLQNLLIGAHRKTWVPCSRAWHCVEKSLRRDALAWRLQWSSASPTKASSAHAFESSAWLRHSISKIRTSGKNSTPARKSKTN